MSFVIRKTDKFFWPVIIKSPKSGGGYEEQTLNLEFHKFGVKELNSFENIENDFNVLCKKIVVGWKDVKDESGAELPFTPENFEALLDVIGVSAQIANQFYVALAGAISKN